jgi:creatinine amidohydrolase
VGSCEQHGRHLSFATDYLIPVEIGRRVSERTGVPVTPPLCFGMSLHHMDFPGTISLSPDTFIAVIRDILRSLHRHGFRRVLVLNGHGGNVGPLAAAVIAVVDSARDLRVKIGNWWQEPPVSRIIEELWGEPEHHATAAETSAIMAIRPETPRLQRSAYSPWVGGIEFKGPGDWKALFPHGATGVDPALASAQAGDRILEAAARAYAEAVGTWGDATD